MTAKEIPVYAGIIGKARERAGLTQGGLADAMGVRHQFVSNIEQGKKRVPLGRVRQIAKILNIAEAPLLDAIIDHATAR